MAIGPIHHGCDGEATGEWGGDWGHWDLELVRLGGGGV